MALYKPGKSSKLLSHLRYAHGDLNAVIAAFVAGLIM